MRRSFWAVMGLFSILILILDPKTAADGVREGISLSIQTVIPALFPFILLTHWAGRILEGFSFRVLKPVAGWLGIPQSGISVFLLGTFGGYPTGAQLIYNRWEQNSISTSQAKRLLGFCNNAGPAFLFGMGAVLFSEVKLIWCLWGIQILSSLVTAKLSPKEVSDPYTDTVTSPVSFTRSLERAVKVMGIICGWVVVFRVLLCILDKWFFWCFPSPLKVFLYGILELSNGCVSLSEIQNPGLRFVLCSVFMSFGGFCVWMQTASCVKELGIRSFVLGKLCQTAISATLAMLLQSFLFTGECRIPFSAPSMILVILCCLIPIIYKITVAFPKKSLYNTGKQKGVRLCSFENSR